MVLFLAKSYRTVFIRVTNINETKQDGLVLYTSSDIEKILGEWAENAGFTYWFIEHSADEEVSTPHHHIVIKFKSPMPFESIKKRFPYGKIESARNIKATIQYLIHLNDRSKKQYSWDDIKTNCLDMTPYKILNSNQQQITLQSIYEAIESGEIREFNVYEKIPIELFAGNKTKIDNALTYYREKVCMDKDRDINVIFVSGAAGTGKTTFAKNYAETLNKSYCISSSSNDPLQDYKGQDVLILDDLREDSFKFHDFIKLLDNHTLSTSKSRYHNKAFIGDTIIITSVRPIQNWYYHVTSEDKHQLYRRIRLLYKFTFDQIFAFEYDVYRYRYEPICCTENYIAKEAKERQKRVTNVLSSMGLELTPIDRKCIVDGPIRDSDGKLADSREAWKKFEDDFNREQAESGKWNQLLEIEKKSQKAGSGDNTKRIRKKVVPKQ